jgi:hypothetical protein
MTISLGDCAVYLGLGSMSAPALMGTSQQWLRVRVVRVEEIVAHRNEASAKCVKSPPKRPVWTSFHVISALPHKTDVERRDHDVRFVPKD